MKQTIIGIMLMLGLMALSGLGNHFIDGIF